MVKKSLESEITDLDNKWILFMRDKFKKNPELYRELNPKIFSKRWFWLKGRHLGFW